MKYYIMALSFKRPNEAPTKQDRLPGAAEVEVPGIRDGLRVKSVWRPQLVMSVLMLLISQQSIHIYIL